MADSSSWGEDTIGAASQREVLSQKQLGQKYPEATIDPKAQTPEDFRRHVDNVKNAVKAGSPEIQHGGYGWYNVAHREAVHLAQSAEPGEAYPRKSSKTGKSVYTAPPSEAAVRRQAGNIAALSPAMDWGKNVQAAREVHGLSEEHVGLMRASMEADKEVATTKRAAAKSEGTPDEDAAYDEHYNAKRAAAGIKEAARGPLKGMALNNQSTANIVKAHDIHTGAKAPEEALPMGIKTGHFYEQIAEPSKPQGATIDTRSADIAMGRHYPWKTPRGLSSQGRYDYFVKVHQTAAEELTHETGLPWTAHKVQAASWVADKQAMMGASGTGHGRHRQGGAIADVHRQALAEPVNAPGPATKKMTGTITAGRNRHGDDL